MLFARGVKPDLAGTLDGDAVRPIKVCSCDGLTSYHVLQILGADSDHRLKSSTKMVPVRRPWAVVRKLPGSLHAPGVWGKRSDHCR